MPNKNYLKGRRKEYKICDLYKNKGFDIVQRTAGSHSPFDIIAVDKKKKMISLIQCKPDNLSAKQTNKIIDENKELNGIYKTSFIVV